MLRRSVSRWVARCLVNQGQAEALPNILARNRHQQTADPSTFHHELSIESIQTHPLRIHGIRHVLRMGSPLRPEDRIRGPFSSPPSLEADRSC
jgi:hypothetical protein